MYTHAHTQTDRRTDGQGELGTVPGSLSSPPPPISLVSPLFLSSRYEFRLVRVTAPPSLLPFPPLQGNSTLTVVTVYCLSTISSTPSCSQWQAVNAKGGVEREKKNVYVYALPTFSHYFPFPSKGGVLVLGKGMAWPRRHWHVHASSFQFNFFIFYFYTFPHALSSSQGDA